MPTVHAGAIISKSRSKTNPFKVTYIAKNGEPLAPSETVVTLNNCKKNIKAIVGIAHGTHMIVLDKTVKPAKKFSLYLDGKEVDLN